MSVLPQLPSDQESISLRAMTGPPRVAVVIISYHGDQFLATALRSVLSQTVPDLEVVVVEDGSRDRAEEIVASFRDPRARYLWQENAGPNAARNTGIRATSAPWVAFLDCDDWWAPTKLATQLAVLEANPNCQVAYSAAVLVGESGNTEGHTITAKGEGDLFPALLRSNCISGSASSLLAGRELLEKAGLFNERIRFAEDWEFWIRLAKLSSFCKVDQANVFILARQSSFSRNTEALRLSAHEVLNHAYADLPERHQQLKAHRRPALANIEFGAAIDYSERNLPRLAFKPLLRAICYDPFQSRFWKRLILLALGKV